MPPDKGESICSRETNGAHTKPLLNNLTHSILDLRAAVVVVGVMERLENLPKSQHDTTRGY